MADDISGTVKTITEELLGMIEVNAGVEVMENKENENFEVNISSEETGLLIGRHGETINSLQLLIGIILYKKTGAWHRIVVNVGDYRQAREENIKQMVQRVVSEVEATGQPVMLPFLTPYERRIVHVMLSESTTVISESEGEGKDRKLTIKPKQ